MCVCFITAGPITKLFAWGRIITAVPVCVFIALVNAGSVCLLLGECVGECGEEKYYMSDVSDRIRVDPDVQMVYGKKRTL